MYKSSISLSLNPFKNLTCDRALIKPPQFPGYPRVTAPRFPAATRWYEGKYLRMGSQLVGRAAILEEMLQALDDNSGETSRSIALTGIGGIG